MNDEVLPVLLREFRMRPPEELRATVFLLSESLLEQFLQETRTGSVKWGTRAEAYRIVLILRGGSREERETIFAALERRVGWQRVRYGEVEAQALVVDALRACSSVLIAAESCTGGLVGKLITDVPGASEIFWGSLVAYSNQAKGSLLGVPEEVIERHGAVSAQTVSAMARGAIELSNADFSCSISGIAGPGGGTPEKPVGTVWIGVGRNGGRTWELLFHFSGDRDMVRRKAALASLLMSETTIRGKEVDNIELWQYI
jgi:PncC family amidohydrolase